MIPYWIFHGFLLILYMAVCIQSTENLLEKCYSDPTICLTLYRASKPRQWWDAYQHCLAQRANLLTIPDHKTQMLVDKFLKDLAADQMVWISGKQSIDQNAVDLAGQMITETIQDNPFGYSIHQNCVYMQITAYTLEHTLYWDDCDEMQAILRAVCQYSHTDDAPCSGISSNGQCFYLDSPDVNINWFTARERCQKKPGSDLIYSRLNNTDVLRELRDAMNPNKSDGSPTCWTGVHKRPWQWITGEGISNGVDMEYFNFEAGYMHLKALSCLILVKRNGTWYWNTRRCHEGINHFICSKHHVLPLSTPATTQQVIASSRTSSATPELTDATQATHVSPDESSTIATITTSEAAQSIADELELGNDDNGFKLLYLIPVIVVVVAAVLIAVVLGLRKRKGKKHARPMYENEDIRREAIASEMNRSSNLYSNVDICHLGEDLSYSSTPDDGPLPDNTISPYGDYTGEHMLVSVEKPANKSNRKETMRPPVRSKPQMGKKSDVTSSETFERPIEHFVTEDGDMYALPSTKITIAPAMVVNSQINGNKSGAVKHKVTPEGDEYALVMKDDFSTSIDDISTSNNYISTENGDVISRNDDVSMGDDGIRHITTESGDSYALVTKDGIGDDDTEHMITESGDVYALPMKDKNNKPAAGLKVL